MLATVRSGTAMMSRRFSQSKRLRQTRRIGTCREWHGRCGGETGGPVGPHSDHHADLCFEAAGASDGSHYRPVRPGASSSSAGHEGPVTADAPDSASDSPPADAGGESRKGRVR